MRKYQLPNGNIIVAEQEFIDAVYPGAILLEESQPEPKPEPEPTTVVTRLAFRNRFTPAEKVGLELAALDDPSAPPEQRQQAATLRAFMKDVDAATFIDLSRPDTVAGVQALEAMGLLAEGRATEILNAPVQAHEVPKT